MDHDVTQCLEITVAKIDVHKGLLAKSAFTSKLQAVFVGGCREGDLGEALAAAREGTLRAHWRHITSALLVPAEGRR